MIMMRQEPIATSKWVRKPAEWPWYSRSKPMMPEKTAERSNDKAEDHQQDVPQIDEAVSKVGTEIGIEPADDDLIDRIHMHVPLILEYALSNKLLPE
jgi:hypothetical protein